MKVIKIDIKRFRSIQDITFDIDPSYSLISFCGENNAGKTNILRAINVFFQPAYMDPESDVPVHKQATAGGQVFPEISLTFLSEDAKYKITRLFEYSGNRLEGEETNLATSTQTSLKEDECQKVMNKFVCKFIEVINLSIPDLIDELIEEVYDIEYEKSRFKGAKQKLKDAFDEYRNGILEILSQLASDISPDFTKFNSDWGVDFALNSDIKKFRDLISDDIEFFVKDKSNKVIGSKGSGLQRLAYLLLQSRIASKLKSGKIPVILIDEPEAFLHPALQKKLKDHLTAIRGSGIQIFMTTHSPVFIDSYHLRNQFLIGINIDEGVYFKRVKKYVNKVNTYSIDLESIDGTQKIKKHLGLEELSFLPLEKFNLIVEGEADKRYIEKLLKFYELTVPYIVPAHGVTNIEKLLDMYKGLYRDNEEKPCVLIVLDNDQAGRDAWLRLNKSQSKYSTLKIKTIFCPNFLGESPDVSNLTKHKENHEIEDFVYPEVFLKSVNELLSKAGYQGVKSEEILEKLMKPAFKSKGILAVVEDAKNDTNPENGQNIVFSSSSHESEKMKNSISNLFSFEGDKRFIKMLREMDTKYPDVKKFLVSISNMHEDHFKT